MKTLMKTILAAAVLVSAGLLSTGATFAQDTGYGPGDYGPRNQRDVQGMPIVEQLVRALHRLELSDEQKESIRTVMQDLKAEVGPTTYELKAGHLRLKELIKADEYDENAVAEVAAKVGKLTAQRTVIASRALSQVYGYLTDEQRARLDEMAAQRQERRGDRRRH